VVRALTHALSTQRLHHAWLFTGTRGVGKTTLARILAKSLNCEQGVSAQPCGECGACTEIDAGRFVDYIELDAASNRGVEEMTQLLEQAVYSPSQGRFKVYMIDEVHMLSGHAFNAMLKTLEEPPPHVKFILATTDPQKIPATVLSRCLQFNLRQMAPEAIVAHLQMILQEEGVQAEPAGLRLLAQAAAGSMRDALSLTDQAIAYSAGNITAQAMQAMLGTLDKTVLFSLLHALAQGDAARILTVADTLATQSMPYGGALADLAVLLSRIAIVQRVADAVPDDDPDAAAIAELARSLHPDAVQLFYSVAVHSRAELALAPDEHAGFIMACLRMLALVQATAPESLSLGPATTPSGAEPQQPAAAPTPTSTPTPPPPEPEPEPPADSQTPAQAPPSLQAMTAADWPDLAARLSLSGLAAQLARQSEWVSVQDERVGLRVAIPSLDKGGARERLEAALSQHFATPVTLVVEYAEVTDDTAHTREQARRAALQARAEQAVQSDPLVRALVDTFDAQVLPGSVQVPDAPAASD